MSETTLLSQPAVAGSGIEEEENMRSLLINCYEVQAVPVLKNSVKMERKALEAFCIGAKPNGLPLFSLTVESERMGGVSFPVERPYREFFTIWNDWYFYAVEPIAKSNKEIAMEGGNILVT